MFGYIKPYKPNLKIKDFDTYKGFYCSLCKTLGKKYGVLSRFLLNYDFTFLSLLSISVKNDFNEFERKSCTFNPLKKCSFCTGCTNNKSFEFSAACLIITFYYKIADDIYDSKGIKKAAKYLLLPYAKSLVKKANDDFPNIYKQIKIHIKSQQQVEQNLSSSIDEAAHNSASMLSFIFSCLSEDLNEKRILDRLGYFIGRWIYLIDALDDLEKDYKNNNYNVFLIKSDINNNKSLDKNELHQIKESSIDILNRTYNEILNTYNLLDINLFKDLIDNIITEGLYYLQNQIISIKEADNERSI